LTVSRVEIWSGPSVLNETHTWSLLGYTHRMRSHQLSMILLSAILLGLVFHNRVAQSSDLSDILQLPDAVENDKNAFFVDYSATRLNAVAS
jgi:hypothetical protein